MQPFGYESFENNEAVEWMEELIDSDDITLIRSALHSAAGTFHSPAAASTSIIRAAAPPLRT